MLNFATSQSFATDQYVQQTAPVVELVITLRLQHNVTASTGVIPVTFALIRLGHSHQQFHLHQRKVQVHQQHQQYRLDPQSDWSPPLHHMYATELTFSGYQSYHFYLPS